MKIKYLLPCLVLSASVFVSCGEEKTEKTESEPKEEVVEVVEEEEVVEAEDEYSGESVQSQWDDILAQIKSGEKENLNMYLDKSSESFSQETWDNLDFSNPAYYDTFSAFTSFDQLVEVKSDAGGHRAISVFFETEVDGEVYESMTMIYFVLEDGLIWINGCQIAG